MIRITHDLIPDVIGSGVGSGRDGCGIKGFISLITRLLMNSFIGAGLDKANYFCKINAKEGEQA